MTIEEFTKNMSEQDRRDYDKYAKYAKALDGISYYEWFNLQIAVNKYFELQIGKTKETLRITDSQEIMEVMYL